MASPHILCLTLICLSFVILFTSSLSTPDTITIPLSPSSTKHPSSDLFLILKLLSSASLTRAHFLKHRNSISQPTKIQTYPKSYGAYSINLNFGTPPQTLPFVLDTGSSLVWFPCSSRFLCSRCSFPNIDPTKIPKFFPKDSSSTKLVGCKNPKCSWFFGSDVQSRCQDCKPNAHNCSQLCPAYTVQYGSASTIGLLLEENLDLPGKIVPDFLVGCSILSIRQPAGIAGFGRGPESIPSQMRLKRFSYCLLSHRFDDSYESSDLILQTASSSAKTYGLSYTPFQNPSVNNSVFREYYYVSLRRVMVGGRRVKIPYKFLEADSDGNGGSIVDSGTTFTFMERPILDLVTQELEMQMSSYRRAKDVEKQSGLSPCYDISREKSVSFPELSFQFKGGAKMALPLANYFSVVGKASVVCLTFVSDNGVGPAAVSSGPAIILGNYQQQDFYMEFDLENRRLGFRPQSCRKTA